MNLQKETLSVLSRYGKSWANVCEVGYFNRDENISIKIDKDEFLLTSDREYDNGFGGQEINENLVIVGIDWWLERHEYDGSEWWEYKELPLLKDVKL